MTTAGVQRKLAVGGGEVRGSACHLPPPAKETVFGKAKQHAAGEVLVSLHDVDVDGLTRAIS
jgi:hypothetical protein